MKNAETEYPEFVLEVVRLTPEELKARVVQLQQALKESEAFREEDDDLKSARAAVSEFNAPYRDVKKAVKLKTSYILELLKSSTVS